MSLTSNVLYSLLTSYLTLFPSTLTWARLAGSSPPGMAVLIMIESVSGEEWVRSGLVFCHTFGHAAQNWTRWRVWPGASFCARGLFRDGQKHAKFARHVKS